MPTYRPYAAGAASERTGMYLQRVEKLALAPSSLPISTRKALLYMLLKTIKQPL